MLAASTFEQLLWPSSGRWSVFTPAVFVCAWLGGFQSGAAATLISAATIWWFFVPPERVVLKPIGKEYALGLLFVLSGFLMCGLLRALRIAAVTLANNQRLLQGILDYSPNAILIKDLQGRHLIVNKGFEDLTGIRMEAALEHTDVDLFPRKVASEFVAKDKLAIEKEAPLLFEEKLDFEKERFVLVSEFPLRDDTQKVFALGVIGTDISERKRDEEALRQSTADLREAQHVAHVGSWRWDFRTNRATWSEELYQIFGIDPKRLPTPLVNPGLKLLTAESILRLTQAIEHLRKGGEPYDVDLEFTRPDGAKRWCAARGEAVRDADGAIIGISATAADITHIKELERLRDEWTSLIAHDLRQPIGVISMASEMIPQLHDDARHEKEQTMVGRIQSACQALTRMVDDLLDMSLLEAKRLRLQRISIDPSVMVRETVQRLSYLTGGRVEIHESGRLPSVFVDPMRFRQVLGNLLSNAVKYGDPEAAIQVRISGADGDVRVEVSNCGKGIDPEELPRLFDRFMRSERTRGSAAGLGLGLYIAKGIVEAHGGKMWAESLPGKMTTFYLSLPAANTRLGAA